MRSLSCFRIKKKEDKITVAFFSTSKMSAVEKEFQDFKMVTVTTLPLITFL